MIWVGYCHVDRCAYKHHRASTCACCYYERLWQRPSDRGFEVLGRTQSKLLRMVAYPHGSSRHFKTDDSTGQN